MTSRLPDLLRENGLSVYHLPKWRIHLYIKVGRHRFSMWEGATKPQSYQYT